MSLLNQAVKGVSWTGSSTLIRAVLQIIQLAVLSRFLKPEELGIFALLQVSLGFCQLFMDMGVSNAIIHKQDVTKNQLQFLYLFNLLISLVLAGCLFFASPFIATFYQQINLQAPLQLAALSLIFTSIGRQSQVLLQKQMRFNVLAVVELTVALLGFFTTVTLAWLGYGFWSPLGGLLLQQLVQSFILIIIQPVSVAIKRFDLNEMKVFIHFGLFQSAEAGINYLNSQFDVLLIGKLFGADVLGGYSLARQLLFRPAMVINPIITRVSFPMMAKVQNELPKLQHIYLGALKAIAFINFPLYVFCFAFADPIIAVIFGDSWGDMVPLFKLLALWCMVRALMNPVGSLMMATGNVKRSFFWNLSLSVILPLAIFIGSGWGVEGVASSIVLMQLLLVLPHIRLLLFKAAKISAYEWGRAVFLPGLFAWICGGSCMLLLELFEPNQITVVLLLVTGGAAYLLLSWFYFLRNWVAELRLERAAG